MKSLIPLIAFAVLMTLIGLYQNWSATFTHAWWFAAAGGVCLAILHFAMRHAAVAMGVLGVVLLLLGLFDVPFEEVIARSMFSGLACGLVVGLSVGYAVKALRGRRTRSRKG